MKRPSFQFYPSDWLRDTALRSCSLGARGMWIDMICYMHEGTPYGHLKVGNKVILPINLASMVGATLQDVEGWLDELRQSGVFETLEDGTICSKRMIRDERLREARAAGGKLGGNPALKVNLDDNLEVEKEVKQIPTPSSSSSSSSSSLKNTKNTVTPPVGVADSVWQDWLIHRKAKRAAVTQSALDGIAKEAGKAGITLQAALEMCCMRGWTGFKAEWLKDKDAGQKSFAEKEYDFKRERWEAMTGRTPQAEIKSYNFMEIEDDTTH
jgi:hypothetical protein